MKRLITFLAAAALLCGCRAIDVSHLESVKSKTYTSMPKKIAITQGLEAISPVFRDSLTKKLAECGVLLYAQPRPEADLQMQIRRLGGETTTITGRKFEQYTSMIRYEFTLVDPTNEGNVWKSQGDFEMLSPETQKTVQEIGAADPSEWWAARLVGQMRRDGLIERCGAPVAIAPPIPPAPAPANAAVTAPPGPTRFTVNGVTYESLEQAETSLRASATAEVAKLPRLPDAPFGTALFVVGSEKPADMSNMPNAAQLAQIMAFVTLSGRVSIAADAEALKQSNLFSDVQFLRADDVAANDFRGAAYKIYFAPGPEKHIPGRWTLARQGGASETLTPAPGGMMTPGSLQKWVDGVKAALGTVSPR